MSTFFQGVPEHVVLVVFIFSLVAMFMLTAIVATVAKYWQKARRDELDATLKQQMIERGMSADEIIRVLQASGEPTRDSNLAVTIAHK
jgi:hypothetical protein